MRGTLALASSLVLAATVSAAPVLYEAYQDSPITIPSNENKTLSAMELTFSIDTSSYVQFVSSGLVQRGRLWFELDGDSLVPFRQNVVDGLQSFNLIYCYLLDSAEHSLVLKFTNYVNDFSSAICQDAYLQALIFLPDTASAVTEQPTSDAESRIDSSSLVSSGPYVNVQGATELVDSSGRVVQEVIEGNRVYISNLPPGTYFARDGQQTVIKIVKVQ